ncbi:MAG: hypothetical protein GY795_42205 [Desulfobacterales bacterium]|nr:hypothetical protein [Desulfobacterales bacterium]
MTHLKASRIIIKVGNLWQSPALHVLLTKEDNVVVARCLDFTVSSHGKDEKDALESLADSVKEYIISAVENNAINTMFDPAYGKYWKIYNELEAKQSADNLKDSIKKSFESVSNKNVSQLIAEIEYAEYA